MTTKLKRFAIGHLLFAIGLSAHAQGTAFTYQGRLSDGVNPANGNYDLRFGIYDAATSGTQLGNSTTNSATAVSNGLFIVTLDFGNQFPGANRWLEISVRTNGAASFFTLSPRQSLTPAPYAITAGNLISNGLATGTYGNAVTFNNANNNFSGSFSGNGTSVSNVNAATLGGFASSNFWQTGGNSIAPGQFLGSSNNQALLLRGSFVGIGRNNPLTGSEYFGVEAPVTNNYGGMYVDTSATNSKPFYGYALGGIIRAWSYVDGADSNKWKLYVAGAGDRITVTTGGNVGISKTTPATALDVAGTVTATAFAGNGVNLTSVDAATVNGLAAANLWQLDGNSVVPGQFLGSTNKQALEFRVNGQRALLLTTNRSDAPNLIAGSPVNVIDAGVRGSVIAGGGTTNFSGVASSNRVSSDFSSIGGGGGNWIQSGADHSFIGSGMNNTVSSNSYQSVIAGGQNNTASGVFSFIGGGSDNKASGQHSSATGFATTASGYSSTAMGYSSTASDDGCTAMGMSTIASGKFGSTAMGNSTTASGTSSTAAGFSTTASGQNSVAMGNQTTAGGESSTAFGYLSAATGYVATAMGNQSVAGGASSTAMGNQSLASGASSIAIGTSNTASGDLSTALGYRARSIFQGSFVWADSQNFDFNATAVDGFHVRATGGFRFVSGIDGSGNATHGASLAANGDSWSSVCDRNAKKNFQPVDGQAVLEKLAQIPVQHWNYKGEDDHATPHLGPMAQDFKAAFYPGRDDKVITTLEFDGVELAAIQGLNQKVQEKDARIRDLEQRLEKLERLVNLNFHQSEQNTHEP